MTTPVERVQTALETLGLKAVETRLESLLEEAAKKGPSYADFLHDLLNCEVEARRTRYLRARLQLAHFPFVRHSNSLISVSSLRLMSVRFESFAPCVSSTTPAM